MNSTEFATHVRYMTRTNSTTFPDADILALMKIRQVEIARTIISIDEDILLIPQITSLVADQREYPFPSDILSRFKRVEAKLDGTNWIVLTEVDLTDLEFPLVESEITERYSNLEDEAHFDVLRNGIYILSGTITTVASGLKIWCNTYPAVIATLSGTTDMSVDPSSTTHGIPMQLHEIWARGVIIDYKCSREKPIPLNEIELSYEKDKKEAIVALRNINLDRETLGDLPNASERGNDGSDY